jgi:hypothetical protein
LLIAFGHFVNWFRYCLLFCSAFFVGETDHKVIVIRADHPHYNEIHTVQDLDQFHPDVISKLLDWLINYKTTEGKEPNELKNHEPCSVHEAKLIIDETHNFYKDLIARKENDDHGYCLE